MHCWGQNADRQLGDGTVIDRPSPVQVPGLATPWVSAGGGRTCALLPDRGVSCWGDSFFSANFVRSPTPLRVEGLAPAIDVSSSSINTCILTDTFGVQCWGEGVRGQLGNGGTSGSITPVDVLNISNASQIELSKSAFACAVLPATGAGEVRCWGQNGSGAVGDGTFEDRPVPVTVPGLTSVTELALGFSFSCARRSDGSVWCWGDGREGQLGLGTFNTLSQAPRPVPGLASVRSIGAGWRHACAVMNDASARCWGENTNGQLGDGTLTNRASPVRVLGP